MEDSFNSLHESNKDLQTGGLTIPALPYDQAQELISILNRIAEKSVVLIPDAWEQSVTMDAEHGVLKAFLSHLDEWPDCHVLLGVRHPDIKAPDASDRGFLMAQDLEQSLPGTASLYPLQEMHLEDPTEKHNLAAYLRIKIKAAVGLKDEELFQMVQGFPGVLNYWLSDIKREQMGDKNDMAQVAADAQAYRYPEFGALLPALSKDERILAIRLALMPRLNQELWLNYKEIILHEFNDGEGLVDELNIKRVMEAGSYPTYGHETRHSAARYWYLENKSLQNILVRETAGLVFRLAGYVQEVSESNFPYVGALIALGGLLNKLPLNDSVRVVIASAASLIEIRLPWPDQQKLSAALRDLSGHHASALVLAAMGLINTLNDAKAENDLARRDALLEELRSLARVQPADGAVREQLANGLFNTLNDAKAENDLARRDALLEELRSLARAHPADGAVREQLAKGLSNTLVGATTENEPARRDALLEELRSLARAHPADGAVREPLTKGLANTVVGAKAENDLARRDALLEELRSLARAHPADAALREPLTKGLFNTLNDAKAENDPARRDALLEELRSLARMHPADAALLERLAKGLFNILVDAKAENDLARRDALLEELRSLSWAHPADAALREPLARGLSNTLVCTTTENDLTRRDALLEELRSLARCTRPMPRCESIWQKACSTRSLARRKRTTWSGAMPCLRNCVRWPGRTRPMARCGSDWQMACSTRLIMRRERTTWPGAMPCLRNCVRWPGRIRTIAQCGTSWQKACPTRLSAQRQRTTWPGAMPCLRSCVHWPGRTRPMARCGSDWQMACLTRSLARRQRTIWPGAMPCLRNCVHWPGRIRTIAQCGSSLQRACPTRLLARRQRTI